jgi:RNA polymerase sigma-70 factor (ECF subfamily)
MSRSRLIEVVTGARVRDLEEVYRLRYTQFLRVATAIGGTEDAGHDAVQEGFADVLRHRRTFRGDGPLEAWVWRAVVNAAHRGRAKRFELAPLDGDEPAVIAEQDDGSALRPWLASLPERQRLAVFLRYYADLDYRTIATVLGVEVGTVSATLSQAHAALRRSLSEAAG